MSDKLGAAEVEFQTIDFICLRTTAFLKRLSRSQKPWAKVLNELSEIAEHARKSTKPEGALDLDSYFNTLVDYAKTHRKNWNKGMVQSKSFRVRYNTLLIIHLLELGLKVLYCKTILEYDDELFIQYLNVKTPELKVSTIDNNIPFWNELMPYCPVLRTAIMIHTDYQFSKKVNALRNLKHIYLPGDIDDKIICQAFWGFDSSSEDALTAILKDKNELKPKIAFPHLESLTGNIHQLSLPRSCWNKSIGALAIFLQVELQLVQCLKSWTTLDALKYLLTKDENKIFIRRRKKPCIGDLRIDCADLTEQETVSAIKMCPNVKYLALGNCDINTNLMGGLLKSMALTELRLDCRIIDPLTLRSLCKTKHLETLYLCVSPDFFQRTKPSLSPEHGQMLYYAMRVNVKHLTLELSPSTKLYNDKVTLGILYFLEMFPYLETFNLECLLYSEPEFVSEFILSMIETKPDIHTMRLSAYNKDISKEEIMKLNKYNHIEKMPNLFAYAFLNEDYYQMEHLETFEIDEIYLDNNKYTEIFLESLRHLEIGVNVIYRHCLHEETLKLNCYDIHNSINKRIRDEEYVDITRDHHKLAEIINETFSEKLKLDGC